MKRFCCFLAIIVAAVAALVVFPGCLAAWLPDVASATLGRLTMLLGMFVGVLGMAAALEID